MSAAEATVVGYLADLPEDQRAALQDLRARIKASAPGAEEVMSYRIPTFRYQGQALVAISAHVNHCSLHLMSSTLAAVVKEDLKDYRTTTGTIRFTPDRPLPDALVSKLVRARIAENNAHPRPERTKKKE